MCTRMVMNRNKQAVYYVCCNFVTCKFVFVHTHCKKATVGLQNTIPSFWGNTACNGKLFKGLSHLRGITECGDEVCFYFHLARCNESVFYML